MQSIYQIRNKVNGKVYVGSTNNTRLRWNNHRSSLNRGVHENPYLQNAWNKYGAGAFEFSVLEEVDDENRIEREKFHINETKCLDRNIGYNIDANPNDKSGENNTFYGKKHTEETKKKLRVAARNRSEETKKKMGAKKENHYKAKLTMDKAREIRRLYAEGNWTHRGLAKEYGVSFGAISALLQGKTWREE